MDTKFYTQIERVSSGLLKLRMALPMDRSGVNYKYSKDEYDLTRLSFCSFHFIIETFRDDGINCKGISYHQEKILNPLLKNSSSLNPNDKFLTFTQIILHFLFLLVIFFETYGSNNISSLSIFCKK